MQHEALVLDMGEYENTAVTKGAGTAIGGGSVTRDSPTTSPGGGGHVKEVRLHRGGRSEERGGMGGSDGHTTPSMFASMGLSLSGTIIFFSPSAPHCSAPPLQEISLLRLYQILPPALAARAKVFGNKLALKEEWVCVDQPYFNAPGAATCCASSTVCSTALYIHPCLYPSTSIYSPHI